MKVFTRLTSVLATVCCMGVVLLIDSCSDKNEADPIPLKADAGADQTVAPLTLVTLDGSASTGDGGFSYEWIYNSGQPSDISWSGTMAGVTTTFTPPRNGTYNFTLRITQGTQFSDDQVIVTVSGSISLTGTLAASIVLQDIEPSGGADYKINGEFIIPAGTTLTTPGNGNIFIEMADDASIIIDGGSFTGIATRLSSATGWKGIWLKSGSFNLSTGCTIEKAGKSEFAGQSEKAALTVTGGSLSIVGVQFIQNTGYDLLMPNSISGGSFTIQGCIFSAINPIKTTIDMFPRIGDNSYGSSYDYLILTTPGAGTSVVAAGSNGFAFKSGVKYYIDGDFSASSIISMGSGSAGAPTTILMKAGAGILASAGVNFGSNAILDGLASAPWKGLAIGNSTTGNAISGTVIKNAGSAVFSTGSFTSDFKAAVYYFGTNNNASFTNGEIRDSRGYGIYNATPNTYVVPSGCIFANSLLPAINAPVNVIHSVITGTTNTFTMPANTAAVEVRTPNISTNPIGTWSSLGGSNFYLFTGNTYTSSNWTLSPGVNLKFKANRSLSIFSGTFQAIGTAANPITFDSETGTAGTWAGIIVELPYKLEFCTIKNGGDSFILRSNGASSTEKANFVVNNASATGVSFKNNTVSGSTAYGLVVETGKHNPDALNVINANTFSTNTSGSVIIK